MKVDVSEMEMKLEKMDGSGCGWESNRLGRAKCVIYRQIR